MRSKTTIESLQTEISGWTLPETFIKNNFPDTTVVRDYKIVHMEGKCRNGENFTENRVVNILWYELAILTSKRIIFRRDFGDKFQFVSSLR